MPSPLADRRQPLAPRHARDLPQQATGAAGNQRRHGRSGSGRGPQRSTLDRAEAAEIMTLCTECGVPHLAADFLSAGLSLDEVKTKVSRVGTVMTMMTIARRKEPSIPADFGEAMLAEGYGIAEIRAAIFERIVAEEEKTSISSHVPPVAASAGAAVAQASMHRTLKTMGLGSKAEAGA